MQNTKVGKKVKELPPTFTGVWINRAILKDPDTSFAEKFIVAEVDALTSEEGPCRASNAHFAALLGSSEQMANNALSKLQTSGKIIELSFHRLFKKRVVNPKYSDHPERCEKWINLKLSSLTKISNPSLTEISNRGLLKSVIEGYRNQEGEIPKEKSCEKPSSLSVERSTPHASGNGSKSNDDDGLKSIEEKKEEVTPEEKERRYCKAALCRIPDFRGYVAKDLVDKYPLALIDECIEVYWYQIERDKKIVAPQVVLMIQSGTPDRPHGFKYKPWAQRKQEAEEERQREADKQVQEKAEKDKEAQRREAMTQEQRDKEDAAQEITASQFFKRMRAERDEALKNLTKG